MLVFVLRFFLWRGIRVSEDQVWREGRDADRERAEAPGGRDGDAQAVAPGGAERPIWQDLCNAIGGYSCLVSAFLVQIVQ